MPIIFQTIIKRSDLQRNPDVLYAFGDNDERRGLGGQAKECRNEPNAVGIRTKKKPTMHVDAFFTDEEYVQNVTRVRADFERIVEHLETGGIVVLPVEGFGTGMAKLKEKAPMTYYFMKGYVNSLVREYGYDKKVEAPPITIRPDPNYRDSD